MARHDKECCYSTRGDLAHAPASLPGSPRHPDGRLQGFKGVGCFYGNAEWVRQQLTLKMQRLYAPLDNVDNMQDSGDIRNSV